LPCSAPQLLSGEPVAAELGEAPPPGTLDGVPVTSAAEPMPRLIAEPSPGAAGVAESLDRCEAVAECDAECDTDGVDVVSAPEERAGLDAAELLAAELAGPVGAGAGGRVGGGGLAGR
jgi:hypothetical protein